MLERTLADFLARRDVGHLSRFELEQTIRGLEKRLSDVTLSLSENGEAAATAATVRQVDEAFYCLTEAAESH